jgi:hypothetical protein
MVYCVYLPNRGKVKPSFNLEDDITAFFYSVPIAFWPLPVNHHGTKC